MKYELKRSSPDDARDIFDMLQEIGLDENGFMNGMNGASYEEYQVWLIKQDRTANGVGLEDWMVPQTVFWLYCDGRPVAYGKLRHHLTDRLRKEGGHMGYAVRSSERGKGHGTALVRLMLKEAAKIGIDQILVTIREDNTASAKVAQKCGGSLDRCENGRLYYWLSTEEPRDTPSAL